MRNDAGLYRHGAVYHQALLCRFFSALFLFFEFPRIHEGIILSSLCRFLKDEEHFLCVPCIFLFLVLPSSNPAGDWPQDKPGDWHASAFVTRHPPSTSVREPHASRRGVGKDVLYIALLSYNTNHITLAHHCSVGNSRVGSAFVMRWRPFRATLKHPGIFTTVTILYYTTHVVC